MRALFLEEPMDDLTAYYAKRAAEYERVYDRPERQADLAALRERIGRLFAGRRVLELACGTGYWTQVIAGAARHVVALDINDETLDVARRKPLPRGNVTFSIGDAYAPPALPECDGLFAGFWWSHVPRSRLDGFLERASRTVAPGSLVAFLDNRFVEGSSTPRSRTDADGNTYQVRTVDDGSTHEVLKNFPSEDELLGSAARFGTGARLELLEHYWLLAWRTPPAA
jgi:demethylmenaquinone methyltransferase/2-methoxy-6-polyprenyl-1,4-benzoquinol methylase